MQLQDAPKDVVRPAPVKIDPRPGQKRAGGQRRAGPTGGYVTEITVVRGGPCVGRRIAIPGNIGRGLMQHEASQTLVGEQLDGTYLIERLLSQGSMGEV